MVNSYWYTIRRSNSVIFMFAPFSEAGMKLEIRMREKSFWFYGEVLPNFHPCPYKLYIKTSPSAPNREKFDPVRRLFLPNLPVA